MSTGSDAGVSGSSTELGKITFKVSRGCGGEVIGHMSISSGVPSVMCANLHSRELYLARFRCPVENGDGGTSNERGEPSSPSLLADSLRFMVGGLNHGCRMARVHVVILIAEQAVRMTNQPFLAANRHGSRKFCVPQEANSEAEHVHELCARPSEGTAIDIKGYNTVWLRHLDRCVTSELEFDLNIRRCKICAVSRDMFPIPGGLILVLCDSYPLPHFSRCSLCPLAASPTSRTKPAHYPRCQSGCEADSHRQKERLVDRVRQNEHGVQSFLAAVARRRTLDLVPAWFWWLAGKEPENDLLHICCSLRHLLSTKKVDPHEGDGEIERREDEVHSKRIPSIGFHEVFEPLRDCRIGGQRGCVLAGAGCGCEAGCRRAEMTRERGTGHGRQRDWTCGKFGSGRQYGSVDSEEMKSRKRSSEHRAGGGLSRVVAFSIGTAARSFPTRPIQVCGCADFLDGAIHESTTLSS